MKKTRHPRRRPVPAHHDWRGQLQTLIDANNARCMKQTHNVSHRTRRDRARALFRTFRLLYAMGFRLAPRNIGGRHVEWLMRYWTADPALGPELATRGMPKKGLQLRQTPYSAPYIQQQLSFLRAFSNWVGKPGLVLPARHYVDDVSLVQPESTAKHDRTRDAHEADFDAILAEVRTVDPRVAVQLEVMKAFGLQRKEAILFSPSRAEVPAHALPVSPASGPFLVFVRIRKGTRGGKLRFTAVRTREQERALAHAREYAPAPGSHIGQPGLTLGQALKRFSNVLNRAGVNRKVMGITPHGMRHQFESDLVVELADIPPPIRGHEMHLGPEAVQSAILEAALQLSPAIAGARPGPRRTSQQSDDACD